MSKNLIKKALFVVILCSTSLFSREYGAMRLVPSNHHIYDDIYALCAEQKIVTFSGDAPLTNAELRLYFDQIEPEKLSDAGMSLYKKVESYFEEDFFGMQLGKVRAGLNILINPTLFFKTNSDISFSFANDYTGHKTQLQKTKLSGIREAEGDYGAANSFNFHPLTKPIVEFEAYTDFANCVFFETVPSLGKSFWAMSEEKNFSNLPLKSDQIEFFWPLTAYVSAGRVKNGWGFNINLSRQGKQIGKTLTGSVIYNSTFQTDGIIEFSIFSPYIKYTLDTVSVNTNYNLNAFNLNKGRILYLHTFEMRPYIKWLKFSIVEGTLINGPFELRYLNPMMVMHQYMPWLQYSNKEGDKYYEWTPNTASYLGFALEVTPVKYTRFYVLYAQNQMQTAGERVDKDGCKVPDSFGVQLGASLNIPDRFGNYYLATLEGIYTAPFLYVQSGAAWSLYSRHFYMYEGGKKPISTWLGSPFGPDAAGAKARIRYSKSQKWQAEISYLFLAHGSNSFSLFRSKGKAQKGSFAGKDDEFDAYFPSTLNKLGYLSDEEAKKLARTLNLTPTVSYTNEISIDGFYYVTPKLKIHAHFLFAAVFNNKNIAGNTQFGAEMAAGLEWRIF